MSSDQPTFRRGVGLDHYDVLLGEKKIGEVFKYEQRFNLRRLIVIRGWRARNLSGTKLPQQLDSRSSDYSCYKTRAEAAQALVEAQDA